MKLFLGFAMLATISAATMANASTLEGAVLANCDSVKGDLHVVIIGQDSGENVAILSTKTQVGPVELSRYNVGVKQSVTHGLEQMFTGPGFSLVLESGSPDGGMSAVLDHGRVLQIEMKNCTY